MNTNFECFKKNIGRTKKRTLLEWLGQYATLITRINKTKTWLSEITKNNIRKDH